MRRQLNIRSDEAYEIAHDLARRLGRSATEVVEAALREYRGRLRPVELTAGQGEFIERVLTLGQKARRELTPGTTSDHSDFYDEDGLPR